MKKNNNLAQFIALVVLILVGMGSTNYLIIKKSDEVVNNIIAKSLAIEYDKVGGKDNYNKINKLNKEQIVKVLDQIGDIDGNSKAPSDNQPQAQAVPSNNGGEISQDTFKKIKNGAYILGNPDAEVTWIEYSDLECPFCKKLHESGTIQEVLKKYDGKVNFIFKQFPLEFHVQAPMEAEAALCAGDLGGKDKYYEFINETFKNSKTNGRSYTKESISKLGATIGLDESKLLSCIESGKNKNLADSQMKEGSSLFGITGTPGNVLINNKTGKWDKLPGAYPTVSFVQKIDNLLK